MAVSAYSNDCFDIQLRPLTYIAEPGRTSDELARKRPNMTSGDLVCQIGYATFPSRYSTIRSRCSSRSIGHDGLYQYGYSRAGRLDTRAVNQGRRACRTVAGGIRGRTMETENAERQTQDGRNCAALRYAFHVQVAFFSSLLGSRHPDETATLGAGVRHPKIADEGDKPSVSVSRARGTNRGGVGFDGGDSKQPAGRRAWNGHRPALWAGHPGGPIAGRVQQEHTVIGIRSSARFSLSERYSHCLGGLEDSGADSSTAGATPQHMGVASARTAVLL
jgi:hypothetical protein